MEKSKRLKKFHQLFLLLLNVLFKSFNIICAAVIPLLYILQTHFFTVYAANQTISLRSVIIIVRDIDKFWFSFFLYNIKKRNPIGKMLYENMLEEM